ncbi:histidine phosphatase family protein [Colwelliaceae bacterium 6441]
MKLIALLFIAFMSFLLTSWQAFANLPNGEVQFTLYLVRHAEKLSDQKNPSLTACGIKRAEQLAVMLEQANIKQIYSTNYLRTQQTAAPLARQLHLPVSDYSPRDLKLFAEKIIKTKQNALIVGHSNTTPQLAALITGKNVKSITEKEYQMLYQIHFSHENVQLTRLKQPLVCQK